MWFAAASAPASSSVADVRDPGAPAAARRKLTPTDIAPLAPAAALVVLWLVWIPATGGYFPDAWYPSAAGACALLSVTILMRGRLLPASRLARVALLSFTGLVALNYLSILWAAAPGSALQASNQLLLYLAVAWTFAILPWTSCAVGMLLGVWSLGVAAFCLAGLVQATTSVNLDPFFDDFRYATPLAYPNATAALAVMGMWPALVLAARRELPVWIRAPMLSIAVFLAGFAFLPQSRGAAVGLVLTVPLVLAVSSQRLRLIAHMAVVGAGLAWTIPRTVKVDDTITAGRHAAPVLQHAFDGMLLAGLAALLCGVLLCLSDRRWERRGRSREPSWRLTRRGRIAVAAAVGIVLVSGGVVAAPGVTRVTGSVWRSGQSDAGTGATRLLSASPEERFDYARVAGRLFVSAPVAGVGAGNFGQRYDAMRRFEKHSQYVHNLFLRVLSETGIVGVVLFGAVVFSLLIGLTTSVKLLDDLGRAGCLAALAVAVYFLIHSSVDWLDQYPALAAPALAFPLAAIATRRPVASFEAGASRSPSSLSFVRRFTGRGDPRFALVAAVAVFTAFVVIVLGPAYISDRYVKRASATFRSRPAGAYRDLSHAATLNPLSANPLITEGMIAIELGEPDRARTAFERANSREEGWYARLELALLDDQAGNFPAATAQIARAAKLDVNDPVISAAKAVIARRQRVDPAGFNQVLLQGAEAPVFRPNHIR